MGRLLISAGIAFLLIGSTMAGAATDLHASFELGYIDASDYDGFLDRGLGKTPYAADESSWKIVDGYVEARSDLGSRWDVKLTLTASEQLDDPIGITEATLTYRPLPSSGRRFRLKLGAFRPPVSFEHAAEGWSSKYTVNASAINSWMGQEIGGLAVEAKLASDPATSTAALDWDLFAAAFMGNDPAGTLLSWSGWSFWSSQSRWGDRIPVSNLPLLEVASYQAPVAEPFLETDNRPGFWLGGTVGKGTMFRVRYVYYDNLTDPNSKGNGQWGWHTKFHSLGAQINLPGQFGIIAQALQGTTRTWEVPQIGSVVDADFDSYFVLLTRRIGAQRLSIRYDSFGITDHDLVAIDPNEEDGSAWTVSYNRTLSERWQVTAELSRIESDRSARSLQNLPARMTERFGLVTLAWTM